MCACKSECLCESVTHAEENEQARAREQENKDVCVRAVAVCSSCSGSVFLLLCSVFLF